MAKKRTPQEQVLDLAGHGGTVTTREVVSAGVHRQVVSRMVRTGLLERVARGLYCLPGHSITENHGLAVVAAAVPNGVVCLLSALTFHSIGTQLPHAVWIAIHRRARRPALDYPPLQIVRFTGEALTEGVEMTQIEGQAVRIYNVAKTIADCFKYRNKIGLDVALEALRDGWRSKRFTMDELDRYAKMCRVERVMKPYLEALVA